MSFLKNILYTSAVTSNQIVDTIKFYKQELTHEENTNKKRVVILGNGWAGNSFHKNLVKSHYDVIVVDKNDYFLETHKMSNTNSEPIKKIENNYLSKFIKNEVKEINTKDKKVIFNDTTINYDYLIFGLGSEVNTFNISGSDKHCLFYKTYDDWKKINSIDFSQKTTSIIGGGAVGIELAYKLKNKYKLPFKKIHIYDANSILPGFSETTKKLVREDLEKKGIVLYEHKPVIKFLQNELITEHMYRYSNYFDIIFSFPYDVIIWTAGIKRHHLLPNQKELEENKENIFVIGDNSKVGPPTAQKARDEGRNLANYFNTHFNNKYHPENYKFSALCKIIHTDDGMFVELSDTKTIWLPKFLSPIIDTAIDFF